jgi:hypothetical protein
MMRSRCAFRFSPESLFSSFVSDVRGFFNGVERKHKPHIAWQKKEFLEHHIMRILLISSAHLVLWNVPICRLCVSLFLTIQAKSIKIKLLLKINGPSFLMRSRAPLLEPGTNCLHDIITYSLW